MKRIITAALIALVVMGLVVTPVYAMDPPDGVPSIDSVYAFRNILETGDMLVIIKENTPYASTPDIPYDKAFIWRMYDTDGTTEIGQATGYPYHEDGYGYNVISFYFDADDAPTWDQTYYLKLYGTPVYFETIPEYSYELNGIVYSTETTQFLVQGEIAGHVMILADDLNTDWGLEEDDYLTDETTGIGVVLSLRGESFFRGAIYGLQSMAPSAFAVGYSTIDVTDRTWTDNYTSALSTQLDGTDIGTAMDAGNTMMDSSYNLFGLIGLIVALGIFFAACIMVGGDIWGTMAICAALAIIGTRMGLVDLCTMGLIVALAGIFVSGKMWKVF